MTRRERRRWGIFAGACVALGLCLVVLWLLLTATDLEWPVAVLGWIAVPLMLGLNLWLVIKCLRTKADDPFYEPDPDGPP